MSADAWLNPDGELLPIQHYVEIHTATLRCSCCLADKPEQRLIKSNQMNRDVIETVPESSDDDPPAIASGADGQSLCTSVEGNMDLAHII